jgi:DNA-3-methyladenine glycosylase
MFGPAGRLYAYRSYGIHTCVNVVCGEPGQASAVLLRAGEPLEGLSRMRKFRGLAARSKAELIARGPGRLAAALGLELRDDGCSLLQGPLTLHAPEDSAWVGSVERGPRVGITKSADLLDRFFESNSRWVSHFRSGTKIRRARPSGR